MVQASAQTLEPGSASNTLAAPYDAPFAGLKVVDVSQGLAAPYCGMLLAQYGADVVKVEPPGGDWGRRLNIPIAGHSAFSTVANLGKRSIELDLKTAAGKQVLRKLLETADVLIEGFRPGAMDRLGFGYEAIRQYAPKIIMVSVSGFGSRGPLANKPAMDPVLQAFTGIALANKGDDGVPHRVPLSMVDMSTGLYAFQAVSTALYARRNAQQGRHIEISLLESAASMQGVRMMAMTFDGPDGPVAGPPSGTYQTVGGWIQLQITKETEWHDLCEIAGLPELVADARFNTRFERHHRGPELMALMRPALASMTLADACTRFTEKGLLYEKLNSYDEFVKAEHTQAVNAVAMLKQPGVEALLPMANIPGGPKFVSGTKRALAPSLGQHTREILSEIGLDESADGQSR